MVTVAAVVVALLVCAAAAIFGAPLVGLDTPWLATARHALAEARHRFAGVLAEFGDWLRLGR